MPSFSIVFSAPLSALNTGETINDDLIVGATCNCPLDCEEIIYSTGITCKHSSFNSTLPISNGVISKNNLARSAIIIIM